MRKVWWSLVVALPALVQDHGVIFPSASATASVTFYSNGSFWRSAAPGYKHGAFAGLIFDGKQQLAHIRPNHFVTFSLPPGPHVFTTNSWLIGRSNGGAHLRLDLVADHHYYVGTYFETTPLVVISSPAIEAVPCEDAQKDAAETEPLGRKQITESVRSSASVETSFPACL